MEIDQYKEDNRVTAQRLADRFIECSYPAEVIDNPNDERHFLVIVDGLNGNKYEAHQWHGGEIIINEWPNRYNAYPSISSHKQSEGRKAIAKSNRMLKPSRAKIAQKIAEIDEYHRRCTEQEEINNKKHADFLEMIKNSGEAVTYEYKKAFNGHEYIKTDEIQAGEIVRNGIAYEFRLHQDGYIEQKTTLCYNVPNTLEAFKGLADNNYVKTQ